MANNDPPVPIKVIFVLGPPGVGKGTLCQKLRADDSGTPSYVQHVSVGDMLRTACQLPIFPSDIDLGDLSIDDLRHLVDNNMNVPAKTLLGLLQTKLSEARRQGLRVWVIDGFPGDVESAALFEKEIARPVVVLHVNCPKHVAQERYVQRVRTDKDTEELFNQRYEKFRNQKMPVVERYADRIVKIDSEQPLSQSFPAFQAAIAKAESDDRDE